MATLTIHTYDPATGVTESTVETTPARVPTLSYWVQATAVRLASPNGLVTVPAGAYVVANELGDLTVFSPEAFAATLVPEPPPPASP